MNAQIRFSANAWKVYASVTEWFAAEDMSYDWVHSGFDDDYEATGGWLDLGALWKGTWVHAKWCMP